MQRVLWGFFKKLVIADRILVAVNTIIRDPATYDGIFVFIGMVFYAIELYADFTGGIDITIGVAQMFGVHLTENFERPYFSKNIAEYWRRWHKMCIRDSLYLDLKHLIKFNLNIYIP